MTADFTMYGARAAIAGGLSHIEEQVKSIETTVSENPGLAFDLAKTVVESTCKTILRDRNVPFDNDDDHPRLFKAVINTLPLLPVATSGEAEARKSLERTLNGLHTALQGVCELRNACGFASHGSDSPRPAMESVQALLAAQAADAIVGFLHRVHHQDRAMHRVVQVSYVDNEGFNSYVDDVNDEVRIFELVYRPSEVLFKVDQEAYRDLLASFRPDEGDGTATEVADTAAGVSS